MKAKTKPEVDNKYLDALKLVLSQVDLVTNAYVKEKVTEKDQILLNVFGLLQTLFVGVDCLYDLVEEVTSNKYLINLNQNDKMHELKFIRNDVVGHPTSRTYRNRKQGFCMLDLNDISYDKIKYDTYIKKSAKSVKVDTREVDLLNIISEFQKEKENILNDLDSFLKKPYEKDLWVLVEKLERTYYNQQPIDPVIDEIKKNLSYEKYPGKKDNRLVWRLDLLRLAKNWETTDSELNNVIKYIRGKQLNKAIEIALVMTNQTRAISHLKLPYLVKEFYLEVRNKEEKVLPYLNNLHDKKHPLHLIDLNELESLLENKASLKLLKFLKDEPMEEKVYLIGSILKEYKKKK